MNAEFGKIVDNHHFEEVHSKTMEKQSRNFGLLTGVVSLVSCFTAMLGTSAKICLLVTGISCILIALIRPRWLFLPTKGWLVFGDLLHRIMSPILVALLFFLVFTPFGFLVRLFHTDFLGIKLDHKRSSYWVERNPPGPKPETLTQQF